MLSTIMRRHLGLLLTIAVLPAQDLALRNGTIWTGNANEPWAQAALIQGGRFTQVGDNATVDRLATSRKIRTIDLQGRLAVPGFNDAHLHFLSGALGLKQVDLTGICTLPAMQQAIAAHARKYPNAPWIEGRGWEYFCFPNGRLPRKEDIDAVVKDRPVFLRAYDGHTAWANSKALEIADINKATPFSGYGEIVKDPQTGQPTGALKEGAMSLVARRIPQPTREQKLAALEEGMRLLASLGITSMHNAHGDAEEIALYDELQRRNKLTVRTSFAMSVHPMDDERTFRELAALKRYNIGLLKVDAVKIMLDGVIESHTAAMLEPYANNPATRGKSAWSPDQFAKAVKLAQQAGFQVFTHAIGDAAVRMALDGYARSYSASRFKIRHRIEHIETIHPSDIARFKEHQVIASMQPIHADPDGVHIWSQAIGPERARLGFPWRSLEKGGAMLLFSSDWPASISLNPIRGLHNAVNRRTIEGKPAGGWNPQERLSVESALRAYTVNAGIANRDTFRGVIVPGAYADIAVLNQNLFRIDPMDIHKTVVDLTVFNGKVIFERKP